MHGVGLVGDRVQRSRGEITKVINSIMHTQENMVLAILNKNIAFIFPKNLGNHVAFRFQKRVQRPPSSPLLWWQSCPDARIRVSVLLLYVTVFHSFGII